MSLTPEERQEIIDAACEKALLLLPEVVGNLIMSKAAVSELSANFYKVHPELKEHGVIVAGTIEHIEGQNPGLSYEKILDLALPEINNRLKIASTLDLTTVNKNPERHIPQLVQDLTSGQGIL